MKSISEIVAMEWWVGKSRQNAQFSLRELQMSTEVIGGLRRCCKVSDRFTQSDRIAFHAVFV